MMRLPAVVMMCLALTWQAHAEQSIAGQPVSEKKASKRSVAELGDKINALEKKLNALEQLLQQLAKTEKVAKPTVNLAGVASMLHELKGQLSQLQASQKTLADHNDDLRQEVLLMQELQYMNQNGVDNNTVEVNLYATLEYEDFANKVSSFDARNVELLISGRLNDRLHGFTEIEFERTAKTSGGNRAGEVEVEQGWLQYDISKGFNPRAGVILVPFGQYNLKHFDVSQDLADRPIMTRRVIPTTWAEAGFGAVGQFDIGDDASINYQAYFVNGLTDQVSDRGLRNSRGAFGSDNNNNKAFVGRVDHSSQNSEIGLSVYHGDYDDKGNKVTGVDVDWLFDWQQTQLQGEWVNFDFDQGLNSEGVAIPRQQSGGYLQLNQHFWFSGLDGSFLAKGFSDPTFTAILRYGWGVSDDDGDIGTGRNKESRWTVGVNYRPLESYVFKCEYQFNSSDHEALERGDSDGVICSMSAAF